MLDWPGSAWELLGGILKRFYLWVLPFVFLQPIDVLDKLGVRLVISDQVVYGLVGLGVFVSAVDILRGKRGQLADAAAREDARGITGTVEFSPFLIPLSSGERGVWFRPMLRLENKGNQPAVYLIQRFDVKIQTYTRIWKTDEIVPDDEMMDRQLAPEIGSRAPTTAYTLAPQAYMDAVGPLREFGPYPGLNPIDVEYEIIVRLSRLFARSTVVEHKTFSFRARVHDGRTLEGSEGGPLGAEVASYQSEQEPALLVPSPIADEFQWPDPPGRIIQTEGESAK